MKYVIKRVAFTILVKTSAHFNRLQEIAVTTLEKRNRSLL